MIRLTGGTWTWGIDYEQIDFRGKAITLEGAPDGSTIVSLALKPESLPAMLVQSGEHESTRIRNLDFQGMSQGTGNAVRIVASHPTIESCRFRGLEGLEHPAIQVLDGGLDLHDCDFFDNEMGEPSIVSAVDSILLVSGTNFTAGLYTAAPSQ